MTSSDRVFKVDKNNKLFITRRFNVLLISSYKSLLTFNDKVNSEAFGRAS